MKKLTSVLAIVFLAAFGATVASAAECPLLVKQLNEAIAKVTDTAKAEEAKKLTAEAEKLHQEGKHADSVKKADEAAKVIGLTLKHK